MFRIKAVAALALAGLGGATMGTDVYLSSHHAVPRSEPTKYEAPRPAPTVATTNAPSADTGDVVTIETVTLTARAPVRSHATRVAQTRREQEYVPCSQWRSLETGPSGRGVRTLCVRDVPASTD